MAVGVTLFAILVLCIAALAVTVPQSEAYNGCHCDWKSVEKKPFEQKHLKCYIKELRRIGCIDYARFRGRRGREWCVYRGDEWVQVLLRKLKPCRNETNFEAMTRQYKPKRHHRKRSQHRRGDGRRRQPRAG
ncbi:uncharacterized protein LOC144946610 [Lampetra fluviatilis]